MWQDAQQPKMHGHTPFSRGLLVALLVWLASCGTFEIGLVPTPTPTPALLRYANDAYGFAFTYPSEWHIVEEAHTVQLQKESLVLRVGYKRVDEADGIGAILNLPTEGTVYVQKLTFLGQTMPAEATIYKRKLKAVTYHPAPPERAHDLVFAISLTDTAGERDLEAYEDVDISDAVLDEVRTILESFERRPGTIGGQDDDPGAARRPSETPVSRATRRPDWAQYVNAQYGFAFAYPPSWSLTQSTGGEATPFGASAYAVHLTQGDVALTVEVQRVGEGRYLGIGDSSAGQVSDQGPISFLGDTVTAQVLSQDGQAKQLSFRHRAEGLDFFIILGQDRDSGLSHEDFRLAEPLQDEAAAILQTFTPYP